MVDSGPQLVLQAYGVCTTFSLWRLTPSHEVRSSPPAPKTPTEKEKKKYDHDITDQTHFGAFMPGRGTQTTGERETSIPWVLSASRQQALTRLQLRDGHRAGEQQHSNKVKDPVLSARSPCERLRAYIPARRASYCQRCSGSAVDSLCAPICVKSKSCAYAALSLNHNNREVYE